MRFNADKATPPSETPLNERTFARGRRYLTKRDPDLAAIQREVGAPPMWVRDPGFPPLVRIILEQQVSLASAQAAFNRLSASDSAGKRPRTAETSRNRS